ncbi:MAG: aspartate--tRNA ligase [Pseudomonadota bacterium]
MEEKPEFKVNTLGGWRRTHDCGSLRAEDVGREVILMGWVNSRRDLGNLIFIDLRDREGLTQVVFDPQEDMESHRRAHVLRNEWVLAVKGTVARRLEGQENPNLPTGAIELRSSEIKILNETQIPPFQVDGAVDASETLRLKYRYLELRRPQALSVLRKRHKIASSVRQYLNGQEFIEVETPFLTKSTPEGARDYLVPSRVSRGHFYALPQSPQLFKQILMIAGLDRYYQIVRCFRDEDLRADRQPEFTQVDLEMAFVEEDVVMGVIEGMMTHIFKEVLGREVPVPIERIEYHDAMERFGTDRPDTRFGMELRDLTEIAARSDFQAFKKVIDKGGVVKGMRVKGGSNSLSRKTLDELSQVVLDCGGKALSWVKVKEEGWQSSLSKFFREDDKRAINHGMDARQDDLILILAERPKIANEALGRLRLEVARRLGLIPDDRYDFVWITKFPLLEYNEAEGRLEAVHHPFTSPLEEDLPLLDRQPERARARSYDLVLNGAEIGGGSIRIHDLSVQKKMFNTLGISTEEAQMKFGFLLEALRYGAPPHGGVALGFDRLVAIMAGASSIRETIAFPKTTSATCPLTDAPSRVNEAQLEELGLKLAASLTPSILNTG